MYLYPVTFSPSNLKFVPEFLGVWESLKMRLEEFYAHVCYLWWPPNVKKFWSPMHGQGSNLGRLCDRPNTLPRHYKSWLIPQGSTSVLCTYTRWHKYFSNFSMKTYVVSTHQKCLGLMSTHTMFSWRYKKKINTSWMKNVSYLGLWY